MIQLRIKEIAASKNMSLKDVCEKAGYKSLPSFYRQINNPESLNMRTIIRIANVIGCNVSELFSEETKQGDFIAFVRSDGQLYEASSIGELEGIISNLNNKEK